MLLNLPTPANMADSSDKKVKKSATSDSDGDVEPVSKSTLSPEGKRNIESDSEKLRSALNMVYDNICLAQAKNAVFTMADCRNVKQSRDCLQKAIVEYENGTASFEEDEIKAINSLIQGANIQQQQKPAVFTFDGAIDILENLEMLQEWVRSNRSPSQKIKDARDSKARAKKTSK